MNTTLNVKMSLEEAREILSRHYYKVMEHAGNDGIDTVEIVFTDSAHALNVPCPVTVHELIKNGETVSAIKAFRDYYNTGLREAKNYVEWYAYVVFHKSRPIS